MSKTNGGSFFFQNESYKETVKIMAGCLKIITELEGQNVHQRLYIYSVDFKLCKP